MNRERFAGICRQLAGRINQAWGELSNDPLRAADGRRDQIIGRTQQDSGTAQEEYARQLKDFRTNNRNWHF